MKKLLLITFLSFSVGVMSSCTKDSVKPVTETTADTGGVDGKLGTGDGGVDRPPRQN